MDWAKLVQLAAPAVGAVAEQGQHGAFLRGFNREQHFQSEEARRQQALDDQKKQFGAQASLHLLEQLQQIQDPVQYEQFKTVVMNHADALGINPKDFSTLQFPQDRVDKAKAAAQLREITDALDAVRKNGMDPYDEGLAGHSLQLPSGKTLSFDEAIRATQPVSKDTTGAIVRPKKVQKDPTSDYGQALARYAKRQGKSVDDLTSDEELAFKKQYDAANDKAPNPVDPQLATLRGLQIEAQKLRLANGPTPELVQVTTTDPDTGEQVTSLVPKKAGEISRKTPTKKEPTQGQYTTAGFAGRVDQAENILAPLEKQIAGMNYLSFTAQSNLPAAAQSATYQSYDQAARNFVNAVLRRESGAAISPAEFDNARKQYLPQPGDTDQVLKQKRQNRQAIGVNLRKSAGDAYEAPAGLNGAAVAKEGDTKEIPGYPGTEQTFRGGKWIRTK